MKRSETVSLMKRVVMFVLLGLGLASCKKDDSYDGKTGEGGPQVLQYNDIKGFYRSIQTEASLGALKEISGTIIIFGLLVIIILIIIYVYRKIYDFNRSMRTLL